MSKFEETNEDLSLGFRMPNDIDFVEEVGSYLDCLEAIKEYDPEWYCFCKMISDGCHK